MLERSVRAFLSSVVLVLVGCSLPPNVRYRCETDGGCALKGQVCASDSYCHPPSELLADGGLGSADGGECVPRDVTAECAVAECGYLNDGCKEVKCPRSCPSGPQECGVNEPNRCGFPKLCTGDGWCWEHPYPQGYSINASWRVDERNTWFVGENRLVLFYDGQRSSLPPIPLPPELPREASFEAVHGNSATNVFVVGSQGAILHWDGVRWEKETGNGLTAGFLRAVVALPDGGAMVGANQGQVLLRVSSVAAPSIRWMQEALPSGSDVREVFVGADERLMVLTRSRELFTKGPSGWELFSRLDGVLNETLAAVMWDGGVLVGGAGGPQALWYLPAGADGLDGGWVGFDAGLGVNDLVVGEGGVLISAGPTLAWLDETSVLKLTPGWNNGAVTVVPNGFKKAFVAGAAGFMAEVDLTMNPQSAVTFRSSPLVRRQTNHGICGLREDRLFVTGANDPGFSNLPRWFERTLGGTGIEWKLREQSLSSTNALLNCFAEENRVFLLGNDGKFFTLKPGGVVEAGDFTNGTGGNYWGQYNGGWGSPEVGYFFTKAGGSFFDEVTTSDAGVTGTFGTTTTGLGRPLEGVWGLGTDVFAVGEQGAVLRFDGTTWNEEQNGSFDFTGVHGAVLPDGARRFVAASSNGAVGVWEQPNGVGTWAASAEPLFEQRQSFSSVWVSSSGAAWLGGSAPDGGAFVARQVGPAQPWLEVPLYSPRAVNGLWGVDLPDGGTSVWVVGPRATILRHD